MVPIQGAVAHLRQDVLLKQQLDGRVRLSGFLRLLRYFPSSSVKGTLLDKAYALFADKHFQAVQTLDEAKLLLSDAPIGTFMVHFMHHHSPTSEVGYCATWVEDKYLLQAQTRALCGKLILSRAGPLVSHSCISVVRISTEKRRSGATEMRSSPTWTSYWPGSSVKKFYSCSPTKYALPWHHLYKPYSNSFMPVRQLS